MTAVNGIVSVVLGETTPLDPSLLDPAGGDRYVSFVLAGNEVARVKLTASAYAVSAACATGVWDPTAGSAVDMAGLDARFVRTNGTSGGVVRTVNGVQPNATGEFAVEPGPSGRVSVTPTTNGVRVETTQAVDTLNGQTGAVSVVAGSNVTVTNGQGTITISAAGSSQLPSSASFNDLTTNSLNVNSSLAYHGGNPIYFTQNAALYNQSSNNFAFSSGAGYTFNGTGAWAANFGNGTVQASRIEAAVKSFVVPHPADPTKEIVYNSLEGPEWGLYFRGSATLDAGQVTITTPEHFAVLALADTITVHLTPRGDCKGLYVASSSPTTVVVRECQGGTSEVAFDYMIAGTRRHVPDSEIVRPRSSGQ